jgi:cyclopropane-fatty-acyl-phospholipid synthase
MSPIVTTQETLEAGRRSASWSDRFFRNATFAKLEALEHGRLSIVDGNSRTSFGSDQPGALEATVHVHDPSFYASVALGGSIGAAEAYVRGEWSASDLTTVIRIFAVDPRIGDDLDGGLAWLKMPLRRLLHRLNDNTHRRSRLNISAHYDISNEFFAQFLDPTMTYSCGYFESPDATLEEASIAKYDRICRGIELSEDDEVLEVGCGWGGFAIHAASRYGCRVTAVTISENQYRLARQRVSDAGLEQRVEIMKLDYRDLPRKLGRRFDKLVSIEMIEAVGHRFFDTYFEVCSRMLRDDGLMGLQAITVPDQRYDGYRRSVDFLQRYIFPGGLVPSVGVMNASIARKTDMGMLKLEEIGRHYADTLAAWRKRLKRNVERIRELGHTDQFLRLWEYYLCYCEGGFRERQIGTVQLVLAKPGFRQRVGAARRP